MTTTKATHTPGPWRVGVPGRGRFCVYATADGHGRGICRMSNTQEWPADHQRNLEADANAALIAAAPALLAACKAALDNLDAGAHGRKMVHSPIQLIAQLRAAVRLAEGGAHGS